MADNVPKVLLVDDEQIVRMSLQQWLEMEGFNVVTAASGQEALQICKFESIPVAVFDIRMPGMDGITLLKEVKKHQPEISILMMTAYASLDDAVACIKEGAYDYIIKPFPPEKLTHLIRHLFERLELQSTNRKFIEQMRAQHDFLSHFSSLIHDPGKSADETALEWQNLKREWETRLRTLEDLLKNIPST